MGSFKKFLEECDAVGTTTGNMANNPSKERDKKRKEKQKGISDPVDQS